MELGDAIRRRRMIRSYSDEPVDLEAIRRIVSRARRGPSAGFSQGVYLIVVTEPSTRKELARLADEDHYVEEGLPPWISVAPVHVVVCANEADYHARYREPDKVKPDNSEIEWPIPYWFVDAGAAMMLLLLAALDEGLGAGFFGMHRLEGLRETLGIPEGVTPIGVVTIGHPRGEQPMGSATRGWRPLEEVVRWGRW